MYNSQLLGEKLKSMRQKRDLTQNAMAKFLELSTNTYMAYERGLNIPAANVITNMAEKLEVSLDWLCRDITINNIEAKTYSDIIRIIVEISDKIFSEIFTERKSGIIFYDDTIEKFVIDFEKMLNLKESNTIDESLFNIWLEKQYETFNTPLKNSIKSSDIKEDLKEFEEDDDLPF